MILLRLTLAGMIVWAVILGLWEHDWRLILAGVATAVVWPLVQGEVTPHEAQPHHDSDHGSPDSSTAGDGRAADPRLLDDEPGAESALRFRTDAELMEIVERWYAERFGDNASS